MSDERDLLEAEAMLSEQKPQASEKEPEKHKPAKLVTCEACPETVYEKDIHKIGNLHLCPKCAEKERASQVQVRVESVREATTPFPSVEREDRASDSTRTGVNRQQRPRSGQRRISGDFQRSHHLDR